MKILKQIFGIDISMDNFSVRFGTIDIKQNQIISNAFSFSNSSDGFNQFLLWTKSIKIARKNIPIFFVMEATGVYYESLAHFLHKSKLNVAVILPSKIRNYAKSLKTKSKTDPIDAASITSFGLERKLTLWKPTKSSIKLIKELTREYYTTKTIITEIKNQHHAKLHAYSTNKQSLKRKDQLIKLLVKQTRDIIIQIKSVLQNEKQLYDKVKNLESIKGLGFISIVTVIAETKAFENISNQKQLASYAGLDVVYNESGLRKGKTSISKRGNKFIRKAVFMPALSASIHNHKMKELYSRLVNKGKNKKLALIAVARKLLLLIYTLWKNNSTYIPNFNQHLIT